MYLFERMVEIKTSKAPSRWLCAMRYFFVLILCMASNWATGQGVFADQEGLSSTSGEARAKGPGIVDGDGGRRRTHALGANPGGRDQPATSIQQSGSPRKIRATPAQCD